ncbi:hypothetical protein DEU56DRAFT_892620 [Suillus clintonianus]|uniref:uncharacterized protein n=1 Tax=Suillus clintonianus TaxID=1904413 RepID=UPI001B87F25E|nr:uncharacterized protein DEU56DRAFT_892620 [Suillus clintonianus]KAG2125400.1 hypothetical protein DEU56DRAFT_892620 [Suillus clintonianus]
MENPVVVYKDVEKFSFNAADIILYVQQDNPEDHTTVNYLFRVHKAILSLHSPAFGSMFLVPIPPVGSHSQKIHDGLLMFRMFDELKDVTDLLQTFYYPCSSAIIIPPRASDTPIRLRGLLNIAQKYQVNQLYEHIVTSIKADWPQTLPRWDFLDDIDSQRIFEPKTTLPWDPELDDEQKMSEPAAAIRIAREFDIPEILPAAFYHLARIKISCEYDEVRQKRCPNSEHAARWGMLTREDMNCLMHGKEEIESIMKNFVDETIFRCCHICEHTLDEVCYMMNYARDPLKVLMRFIGRYELCEACRESLTTRAIIQREDIWSKLPEIFHLPVVPPWCTGR